MRRSKLEIFKGEFEDWNPEKRDKFPKAAHSLIKEYTYVAVGSVILKDDYQDGERQEFLQKIGGIYTMCIHDCLVPISYWRKNRNNTAPLNCVFEDGIIGKSSLEFPLNVLKKQHHIESWSFSTKECRPLQAADIVAYEFYKFNKNTIINGGKRDIRKSARDLLRPHELQYFTHWDANRFEAFRDLAVNKDV